MLNICDAGGGDMPPRRLLSNFYATIRFPTARHQSVHERGAVPPLLLGLRWRRLDVLDHGTKLSEVQALLDRFETIFLLDLRQARFFTPG